MRSARRQGKRQRRRAASAAAHRCSSQPTPELKITPRVVYQEVEAGGFNREDHYILFDNQFTTTGGDLIGKRKQYLIFREKFKRQDLPRRSRRS